jgi:tRNA A-37 threonylcarbamoyl transferase component Bud32
LNEKEHFKIIYKDCGHGVHGNISVVERNDGKLIVWKRARSNSYRHQESFRQEIKKSKRWRQFGVSKVKVCWHHDGISLLKTYVKGPTLKQMLKNGQLCFSKKKSKPVKALGKFVSTIIDSRHYIADINRQNLVFDSMEWQLIDSSIIHKKTSRSVTKQKYKKAFLRSWSKSIDSKKEKRALRSFLEKYCC